MTDYNPGSFSDVFNTPMGKRLWAYLNEHENLIRMETATFLGRPAAEPLSPGLLATFGDEVKPPQNPKKHDRIKQCIGNMIRQILEPRGYQIDRQNVRIDKVPRQMFTSATRYKLSTGNKDKPGAYEIEDDVDVPENQAVSARYSVEHHGTTPEAACKIYGITPELLKEVMTWPLGPSGRALNPDFKREWDEEHSK
jgi:hypothetical protein